MRIRLNCISCGHAFELGDAYEDYEGEVRCATCRAILVVALREGKLCRMRQSAEGSPTVGSGSNGGSSSTAPRASDKVD